MSFVARFAPKSMSTEKYDEVMKRLTAAGAAAPKGRIFHVSFGPHDALRVSDVWESQEDFDRFGQILMPILQEVGIDPGEPELIDVYNLVEG